MDQKFKKKKQGKYDSAKKRKFNESQGATNGLQAKEKPVVPKKPKITYVFDNIQINAHRTTEEDLPRGHQRQSVAPTEASTNHNDNDVLFGKKPQTNIKKMKKVKKQQPEEEMEEEPLDPVAQQLVTPDDVYRIRFAQLSPGVCLLGVIRELAESVAFLDLPCEVGGSIGLEESSDIIAETLQKPKAPRIDMTKIYRIGQIVRCVVVKTAKIEKVDMNGNKKISDRVHLSTRGSLVNQSVMFDMDDSIRKGTLLTGCIKSVEDHGYVITFGNRESDHTGFLLKKNAENYMHKYNIKQFLVGQPLDCIVDSVQSTSSSRTIQVTLEPDIMASTQIENYDDLLTHESVPIGALVKAKVNSVLNSGLHVIFLQYFGGTVHTRHLDLAPILTFLTKNGSVGNSPLSAFKKKTLDARIVYVDRKSKRILLSTARHICQYSTVPLDLSLTVGQVVHEPLLLQKLDSTMMLAFRNSRITENNEHPWNISLVFQSKRGKMSTEDYEKLSIGEKLPSDCHITSLDYFEGHFRGQLLEGRKKNPEEGLAFKDVLPGSLVNCIIQKVDPKVGLLVGVEGGVSGSYPFKALIPLHHVMDMPLNNLNSVFQVGKKLQCRVVTKDEQQGKLILTNKKTLLETDLAIITEYDAKPGTVAHGVVSDIDDEHGVAVQFYNDAFGIIPIEEINELYPEHVSTVFSFGQPVKVQVVRRGNRHGNKKKGSHAIALTLKITSVDEAAVDIDEYMQEEHVQEPEQENDQQYEPENFQVEETDEAFDPVEADAEDSDEDTSPALHKKNKFITSIQTGSIISGTVTGFLTAAHLFGILPGYENKNSKVGVTVEMPGGVFGYLLDQHTSDCPVHYKSLRPSLKTAMKELLVVDKLEKQKVVFLSMKPCLLAAAKQSIKSSNDLTEHTEVWGYITSVSDNKLEVNFVPQFKGTVHLHNIDLGKKRPHSLSKFFAVGQSLRSTIVSVKQAKKKDEQPTIELALQLTKESTFWLTNYFKEEEEIFQKSLQNKKSPYKNLTYGGIINVTVQSAKPFGTTFAVPQLKDSDVSAFAMDYHISKVSDEESDDEDETGSVARILDMDKNSHVIDVSLRRDILKHHDKPYPALVAGLRENFYIQYHLSPQEVFWHSFKHPAIRCNARIELVKSHYIVVSVPTQDARVIVYVATKDYNDVRDPSQLYHVGETIEVCIPHVPASPEERILGAIPRCVCRPKKLAPPSWNASPMELTDESKLQILNDVAPGMIVQCTLKRILKELLLVQIGTHITGTIHCTQILDDIPPEDASYLNTFPYNLTAETASPRKTMFQYFQEGQILIAKVIGVVDGALFHKFLPVTHQQLAKTNIVELTIKPSEIESLKPSKPLQPSDIHKGDQLVGIITDVSPDKIRVEVSHTVSGHIPLHLISNDLDILSNVQRLFQPGQPVPVKVTSVKPVIFALNYPGSTSASIPEVKPGNIVIGKIFHKEVEHSRMFMKLSPTTIGQIHITDIDDVFHNKPLHRFHVDDILRCYIVEGPFQEKNSGMKHPLYRVSLRQSLVDPAAQTVLKDIKSEPTYQPAITELSEIKPGSTIHGFCSTPNKASVPVQISRNPAIKAVIPLSQRVATSFFYAGRLITAQVAKIDKNTVTLALSKQSAPKAQKQTASSEKSEAREEARDAKMVEAIPREYKNFKPDPSTLSIAGEKVFKRLNLGTVIKALVIAKSSHSIYALADKAIQRNLVLECQVPDINELHTVQLGQKILLCLISKDYPRKAFNFRLVSDKQPVAPNASTQVEKVKPTQQEEEEEEEDAMEEEVYEEQPAAKTTSNRAALESKSNTTMSVGLEWDDFKLGKPKTETSEEVDEMELDEDQLELDENEDSITNKKASKKHKALQKEIKEQLISKKEAEAAEGVPQTAMDYERLVLGSPNNSFLWIKFMAFHLSMAEIDKARQIAERALKTISFREEKEKLNVYVAWMNLENLYGSQDSLLKVFNQALLYSEPKEVYFRLLEIYNSSKNVEQEETLLKTMLRKFKDSGKVWEHYAQFLINNKSLDDFRNMIPQCINALPKRKHIPMISKFAQLEFKHGSADRGRTIFEGIVANYPKRIDIWNIYLDMEIKAGDLPTIRRLFDRVTSLSVSTKKMKFFFKKYLNFEKQYGDDESIERVKHRAMEYVEAKSH